MPISPLNQLNRKEQKMIEEEKEVFFNREKALPKIRKVRVQTRGP